MHPTPGPLMDLGRRLDGAVQRCLRMSDGLIVDATDPLVASPILRRLAWLADVDVVVYSESAPSIGAPNHLQRFPGHEGSIALDVKGVGPKGRWARVLEKALAFGARPISLTLDPGEFALQLEEAKGKGLKARAALLDPGVQAFFRTHTDQEARQWLRDVDSMRTPA